MSYAKRISLWVERLCFVAVPSGSPRDEDSKKAAARCPKTGPPGREGTKANYKTVGK
ncbi:hypothetical protein JAO76_05230 [Pontibacter sp. BT310]|uniref:hypothetical protein n=1 Tax=Pontibacter humidus TaxID=2795728 RepID=UPI0018EE185D|nr:hypothetical protein [Pontibacter sp. BT310]MBJ6117580.1 hypothetical protein [Pontibacter sp. BT310]MBR0570005.1 hypothetical protein [Microvirga sp. STS03]